MITLEFKSRYVLGVVHRIRVSDDFAERYPEHIAAIRAREGKPKSGVRMAVIMVDTPLSDCDGILDDMESLRNNY